MIANTNARTLLAGGAICLLAFGVLGVSAVVCSNAATQWSPESQAQATIMLRETPVPTPQPRPTLNPTVVAAWDEAELNTIQTIHSVAVWVLRALAFAIVAALLALSVRAASSAARHAKATAMLMPMAGLPRSSHVQLPGGVLDKRTDRWTEIGEGDKEGDNEILVIEGRTGVGKIAAVAGALGGQRTRAELARVEYLASLEKGEEIR